jgi:hypothetical protein
MNIEIFFLREEVRGWEKWYEKPGEGRSSLVPHALLGAIPC